jgi:hypothetical protein
MAKKTDKKGQKDMYASNKRTTGKGNVGLESYRGRLRLSLPRQWYGGKQKYLSLGLSDTPENRAIANQRIAEIERDWKLDNFDPTLERYKNGERGKANLSVIESPEVGGSAGSFASSDRRGKRTRADLSASALSVMRVANISLNRVC